ncbi:MAG: helix-turn-helix domain-containing protein [Armatimonadetes bacterium]|nr:helix-turn-helix domain-containing protein [Armatimonadota bacterium]
MAQEIMTAQEAAQYLRLGIDTLKRWARAGEVPGRRIGRQWRFSKAALDDWLAQGGPEYEALVDRGLLEATEEAMADVAAGRSKLVPWDEAKQRLGL